MILNLDPGSRSWIQRSCLINSGSPLTYYYTVNIAAVNIYNLFKNWSRIWILVPDPESGSWIQILNQKILSDRFRIIPEYYYSVILDPRSVTSASFQNIKNWSWILIWIRILDPDHPENSMHSHLVQYRQCKFIIKKNLSGIWIRILDPKVLDPDHPENLIDSHLAKHKQCIFIICS